MARISVHDLVQLPKLDVASAVRLGEGLAAAAAAVALPPALARAAEEMRAAHQELVVVGATPPPADEAPVDSSRAAAADRTIDTAWTALYEWLTGWSKVPGGAPEAHKARAILADLFPEGVAFTLLAHRIEWTESQARLAGIAERKLDRAIADLGGAPVLEALRAAHKRYGGALGMAPQSPQRARLQHAFEEFLHTLRLYVVKVTIQVDPGDPATIALADALLAPLAALPGPPPPVSGGPASA